MKSDQEGKEKDHPVVSLLVMVHLCTLVSYYNHAATLMTARPASFPAFISAHNLSISSKPPCVSMGRTRPRAVKSRAYHLLAIILFHNLGLLACSTSLSVPTTLPTTFNRLMHIMTGDAPAIIVESGGKPTHTIVPPGLNR